MVASFTAWDGGAGGGVVPFGMERRGLVSTILLIPVRLAKLPLHLIRFTFHKTVHPIHQTHRARYRLPVSGLDENRAQSIYFALQRAAATPREEHIVYTWLQALQVAQVASGRVLAQLALVDANVHFWRKRLARGGHFWFALLHRGPVAFAERTWYLCRKFVSMVGVGLSLSNGSLTEVSGRDVLHQAMDEEVVEARVLLFGVLRSELCEALAEIQHAASYLYLKGEFSGMDEDSGMTDTAASEFTFGSPGTPEAAATNHDASERDGSLLFDKTETAVRKVMIEIVDAFEELRVKADDVLKAQILAHRPDTHEDREAFAQTLLKALGVSKLKKIWSKQGGESHPLSHQTSVLTREVSFMDDEEAEEFIMKRAQKIVGIREQILTDEGSITVHDALKSSQSICSRLQRTSPLVKLPEWMLMPSKLQQHWIRYTFIAIGAAYGGSFLLKHSPLYGSKDLENWTLACLKAVRGAWTTHVIEPLENLQGELFNTFRRRPSIVSIDEYESDRDSLSRMLQEFKVDVEKKRKLPATLSASSASGQDTDNAVLEGMEVLMHCYENELKKPIRNLVAGDLMRSLLIQVQKMKVDTESAMLEIDQILKANELSISLVAAIPAFIIAGACLYTFGRVLTPSAPDPRKEATRSRLAMVDVERSLEYLVLPRSAESISGLSAASQGPTSEHIGEFWFRLAVAYDETESLFERKSILGRTAANEEWVRLRSDLLALASPTPSEVKLRSAARMLRVYSIYQR